MESIRASENFTLKGKPYKKGDEIKNVSKEELIRLNERGFIKPLSFNDIKNFDKSKKKKEGKENE